MRFSKKVDCFFDNILWYAIYLLPILLLLIKPDYTSSDFVTILSDFVSTSSPIFGMIDDIFTLAGFNFISETVVLYLAYFSGCVVVHLLVDVILYIFRVLHHLLSRSSNA